ncbi:hypothetical protein DL766_008511 [Monosporascus sp. MC13-8B]|nr:hypothetical protein DL763_007541 [Monosporascus cannonballus]RYP19159.1 hypothetical protein DL766_008511 [Monosporascus sp. MC13-8B]
MDPNTWNGQDPNLSSTGDDDFHQFLEMGGMSNLGDGLHFDFQDFNAGNNPAMMQQARRETIDTPMDGTDQAPMLPRSSLGMQSSILPMTSTSSHQTIPTQVMPPQRSANDAISEIDAQIQHLQFQRLQQEQRRLEEHQRRFQEQQAAYFAQQQRCNMVPPTPQSLEIQAANRFYTHSDQGPPSGVFEGYSRLKEQQDAISPAVTPLDTHFSIDAQYTVPGAYFSPLTSPALHAQSDPLPTFDGRHSSHATNSPVEMDIESPPAPTSSEDISKKVRKSNTTRPRKSNVRQSPITKPQRRKNTSTPNMKPQVLSELAESAAEKSSHQSRKSVSVPGLSTGESENASVSPEALSDMPPPPVPQPRSARQSPRIQAQPTIQPAPLPTALPLNGKPSPATPASLFKISPQSKSTDPNNPDPVTSEQIESFELPESVNFSKPQLPSLDTQQSTRPAPESEATKSTFQTLPSPVFPKPTQPTSAHPSPQLTPKGSTTPNPRKTPLIGPRGSKKRASISSAHVSPALRPRISPNIKPLLPGTPGMSAEDTASQLLASKSNYQRILEGSTVPGVTYPSELSTNLTSKRTSHKIAEQGRRNRINSALQEIATLLPKSVTNSDLGENDESGNGDRKDGKQPSAPNSKASTVELAIVYIKQLQQEVAAANIRAEAAEKKLEEKISS